MHFSVVLLAVFASVSASPLKTSDNVFANETINGTSTPASISLSSIDDLGLTEDLLQLLTVNLQKAIAKESEQENRFRQGGIGDFFGVGGGGQGGQLGAGQDEDEYDEEASTIQGPGPFGVLSGLYGIFSGLGSLNPRRVIASTVNFFPPDQRAAAQSALDTIFGVNNVTTLAPLTNAPAVLRTTPMPLVSNATTSNGTAGAKVRENSSNTTEKATTATFKPILTNSTFLQEDEPLDNIPALSLESEFSKTADIFKVPSKAQEPKTLLELEATTTTETATTETLSTLKPFIGVQNVSEIIVRVA